MRDDFNKDVKDTLAKRVGFLCSNPDCRVLTTGPNSKDNKSTSIGVAAHITAASPNGPRYNETLIKEDRKSIKNGIWLCQSCAKLIDSDPEKYSVELLKKWKEKSESSATNDLGQQKTKSNEPNYQDIFRLMPELIDEFITDLKDSPLKREFILMNSTWLYNSGGKKILAYYYDFHEDLDDKIRLLENNGLIKDITYNNTKRYLFTEEFAQILLSGNKKK